MKDDTDWPCCTTIVVDRIRLRVHWQFGQGENTKIQ